MPSKKNDGIRHRIAFQALNHMERYPAGVIPPCVGDDPPNHRFVALRTRGGGLMKLFYNLTAVRLVPRVPAPCEVGRPYRCGIFFSHFHAMTGILEELKISPAHANGSWNGDARKTFQRFYGLTGLVVHRDTLIAESKPSSFDQDQRIKVLSLTFFFQRC